MQQRQDMDRGLRERHGTREQSATLIPFFVQYFFYQPTQNGDIARNPAMISGILASTKSTSSSVL